MRLSEARRAALYDALAAPISNLRVGIQMSQGQFSEGSLDRELFGLEQEIWRRMKLVLVDGWPGEREGGDG